MPSVLVTGGAGFIGSHLVDHLLENGWSVTAVDNFDPFYPPEIKRRNIQNHRTWDRYRLVEADIRDIAELRASLTGEYDLIVHLAARAGVRPSIENPLEYQSVNVSGTQNLLELARLWKIPRFIFASSSSVYGVNPNVPWREDDLQLMPISPYAASKISGEAHRPASTATSRTSASSRLRFFTVYGPRQRPDLAIHRFASRIVDRRTNHPLRQRPDQPRLHLHRRHRSRHPRRHAIRRFALRGLQSRQLPDRHTPRPRRWHRAGHRRPRHRAVAAEQTGDVPRTCADIGKARRLLGYQPATELRRACSALSTTFYPARMPKKRCRA